MTLKQRLLPYVTRLKHSLDPVALDSHQTSIKPKYAEVIKILVCNKLTSGVKLLYLRTTILDYS